MPSDPSTQPDLVPDDLGSLDLAALGDFVDTADAEVTKYELRFILNTDKIRALDSSEHPLTWNSIRFGSQEAQQIPDDERGIYAFVVSNLQDFLPPHGYIMYIGIAGRDSDRSLRARYRDYLMQSKILERPRVARMIERWLPLLRFHYATVGAEVTSEDLKYLERRLNTAFLPPCSRGDVEADTRQKLAAF